MAVELCDLGYRAETAQRRSESLIDHAAALLVSTGNQRLEMRERLVGLRRGLASARSRHLAPVPVAAGPGAGGRGAGSRRLRPRRQSLQELAELYARTHAFGLRDKVLRAAEEWIGPLGRGVARGSAAEGEDVVQVANLAVLAALERYDPQMGAFEPYARATVAGEVRHYLRATEWSLRVPRRYQEAYRVLAQHRDDAGRLGDGSPSRLEALTGLGPHELREVMGLRRRAQSLDGLGDASGDRWLQCTHRELEAVPDIIDLRDAVDALDPEERRLIEMSFFSELTQRQMASRLGTNQVKVHRGLNRTLARLRRDLTA